MQEGRRILCVDDDEDTCEMLKPWLNSIGYEAASVNTAAEALALAKKEHFDLYLLDVYLEDLPGIELCRQLLALHPDRPIIFYSAAAREADRQAGLTAGARAYFVKPLDLDRLEETIKKLIGNK